MAFLPGDTTFVRRSKASKLYVFVTPSLVLVAMVPRGLHV